MVIKVKKSQKMADLVFETKSVLVPAVCFLTMPCCFCVVKGDPHHHRMRRLGAVFGYLSIKGRPCKMFGLGLRSHQRAEVSQSF